MSVGVLALALVLAQLLLPGIAAKRVSSRLARYGTVVSVSVSAWPAVELLWGSADSVDVHAAHLHVTPAQTAALLWEARGIDRLTLTATSVREGPLRLSGVSFEKHGDQLAGQGHMSEAAIQAALPAGMRLQLLSSERGQVKVRASGQVSVGGLFGAGVSVDVLGLASAGQLIARPLGPTFGGLHLTLFSSPHVQVQAVAASRQPSGAGAASYLLAIRARLH